MDRDWCWSDTHVTSSSSSGSVYTPFPCPDHFDSTQQVLLDYVFSFAGCRGILVRPGHQHSEAEISHNLITPLLRCIAHSLSAIVPPEGCEGEFSSALQFEVMTQANPHMAGEKPRVHYLLSGQVGDKYLYVIPVEVKKEDSLLQGMTQYLSTLGRTEPFIGTRVRVGMLLDDSSIHLVFAPFMLENKVHLPIALTSPPLPWISGIMLTRGVCV